MRLLLDTHVLIWFPTADPRLSAAARQAIENPSNEIFVSAVTAFELTDLQGRERVAMKEDLTTIGEPLGLSIVDFPAEAWALAATLPRIHRDPVDRMMVAHAVVGGFTLVTADRNVHRYPVPTLW